LPKSCDMSGATENSAACAPPAQDGQTHFGPIVIVGRNVFQNRLIQTYLENRLPGPGRILLQTEWRDDPDACADGCILLLLDCFDTTTMDLWRKLGLGGGPDPTAHPMALFNVMAVEDDGFEGEAIERGVRGIFYIHEPPERLAKGVEKMLNGELWYSRKATSRLLMDPQRFRPRNPAMEAMLTAREREILIAIASGAGNSEIADEFQISLHTVKTHLYNTYKKIDVRNRLEATLWVARYLF